jgi:hypothetical protein
MTPDQPIGDRPDMLRRIKAVLPARWFADTSPVLDGVLSGLAAGWAWLYGLLDFVIAQTRIATATGVWLDMIARDCFGARLFRRGAQADDAFRTRIQRELLRERGTRGAISAVLQDLTGRPPVIFEPARAADTGAYGLATGYGMAGAWGSLNLPYQCFVTAFRPHGNGIAQISGWGAPAGGYGRGALEYASLDMVQGQVTDEDINAAIAGVLPVATVAWTRITN